MPAPHPYVGRFAPSPTGPLHLGSLVAAMAASLDARAHQGRLRLRIDDVDSTRVVPGAADAIVHALAAHGVHWDGPLERTTQHGARHEAAFTRLETQDRVYACCCSRNDIARYWMQQGITTATGQERVYPGTCRPPAASKGRPSHAPEACATRAPFDSAHDSTQQHQAPAWRFVVPSGIERWVDRAVGEVVQCVANEVGDFVLRRADGQWSYHLAIVVDDAADAVTDVVRGDDLLMATARQRVLQRALGLTHPRTLHVPVLRDATGQKLSKQSGASALALERPLRSLFLAARHLQLGHPPEPLRAALDIDANASERLIKDFWSWATAAWAVRWLAA
jgi:glutamyl-Q tRNA(Asp) synthetase